MLRGYPHVLVGCAGMLVYFNAINGPFLHDDVAAVLKNDDVQEENPYTELWLNDYWGVPMESKMSHKSYRPLTVSSFRLTHHFWGNRTAIYRTENILLHGLVSVLLLVFCRRLVFGEYAHRRASLVCGVLFALHPIHTEAVVGVVGRAELLCAIFYLLAVLAYSKTHDNLFKQTASVAASESETPDDSNDQSLLAQGEKNDEKGGLRKRKTGNDSNAKDEHKQQLDVRKEDNNRDNDVINDQLVGFTALAFLLTFMSMLCKETGITAIAVMVVMDVVNAAERNTKDDSFKALRNPYLLLKIALAVTFGAATLLWRLWMMDFSHPQFHPWDNVASFSDSFMTRSMTYLALPWMNFALLLWPQHLCYDWNSGSIPLVTSLLDSRNVVTVLFYALLATSLICTIRSFRNKTREVRPLVFGLAMLVLPFIPASNLFFVVGFVMAERCLFLPSVGFVILLALLLCKACDRHPKYERHFQVACAVVWLLYAGRTVRRNMDWSSRASFYRSCFETNPANAKCKFNWANSVYYETNRMDEAAALYQQVLDAEPHSTASMNNLATIYQLQNKTQEAEELFLRSVKRNHVDESGHLGLTKFYISQRKWTEAEKAFKKGVKLAATIYDLSAWRDAIGQFVAASELKVCERSLKRLLCRVCPSTPPAKKCEMPNVSLCSKKHVGFLIDYYDVLAQKDETRANEVQRRIVELTGELTLTALVRSANDAMEAGNVQEAVRLSIKVLAKAGQTGAAQAWQVASRLWRQKQYKACCDLSEEILKIAPDNAEVLSMLASANFEMGKRKKAEKLLVRFTEKDVRCEQVQVWVNLAFVHEKQGKIFDSIRTLTECSRVLLIQSGPDADVRKAKIYARLARNHRDLSVHLAPQRPLAAEEHWEHAKDFVDSALQLNPADPEALQWRKEMRRGLRGAKEDAQSESKQVDEKTTERKDRVEDEKHPPAVAQRNDPEEMTKRIDPKEMTKGIDPEEMTKRIDPEEMMKRIDPEEMMKRIELDKNRAKLESDPTASSDDDVIKRTTPNAPGRDDLKKRLDPEEFLSMQDGVLFPL